MSTDLSEQDAAPYRFLQRHQPLHQYLCDVTGEIFGGLAVPEGCNDGHILVEALGAPGASVPAVLSRLRGPWAVVYWQAATETVWIGRDPVGAPQSPHSTPWQCHQSTVMATFWGEALGVRGASVPERNLIPQ